MTTTYTLTGDFADILGTTPRARSVRVLLETNLGDEALVDLDTNEVRLSGPTSITLDDNMAFSLTLIATNSTGINVTDGSLRYRVTAQYVGADRRARTWDSDWFSLTADTDLSDVVAEVFLPPTFASAAIAQVQALVDEAELITGYDTAVEAVGGAITADDPTITAPLSAATVTALSTDGTPERDAVETAADARVPIVGADLFPARVTSTKHAPAFGLYFPEAEGAVGDGVTDDRAALDAAIAAAAAAGSGRVVGKAGAVYGISTTVTMKSNVTLDGLRIKGLANNLTLINVTNCTDFAVLNCRFTGTGTLGVAGRGAIYGQAGTTGVTRGKIIGNTIDAVGTCGIAVEAATGCVISNNIIRRTAEHGIYVSTGSADCVIANNVITEPGYGGTTNPVNGIKVARASHIHLRDNVITGAQSGGGTGNGILFEFDTADCSAIGNEIRSTTGEAIRVNPVGSGTAPATRITIASNVIRDSGAVAIRCYGGATVEILNNAITASAAGAILVASGTTDVVVNGNVIIQSGGFHAIDLTATGIKVDGNVISQSGGGQGIYARAGCTGVIGSTNRAAAVLNQAGSSVAVHTAVGNAVAATTLGSVVKKVEAFDAQGTSIGYVPIYNSIT